MKKKVNGEMAEWSNAVDSKSIVRVKAYLGFESLSLRQHKHPKGCFFVERKYDIEKVTPRFC